ncbi:MAG: 16S rRNA (cytidine(1402)-2'-O)-methyltransferase, partial [Nitrospirae bacterium]|nr:16S rRNA (cytidine(1402)-2'-O)-methyltransferase [Nitrospirota bacterium]
LGDRKIVLTRELTKVFEEVIRGRVSEVIAKIEGRRLKGEMTLLLEGVQEEAAAGEVPDLHEYLKMLIEENGLSLKDAVSKASKDLDIPRKRVYKEALSMQKL